LDTPWENGTKRRFAQQRNQKSLHALENGTGKLGNHKSKLVIFDCDGVLVDSEPLSTLAYQNIYHRHGVEVSLDVFRRCIGMKQTDILELLKSLTGFSLPPESIAELWPETRQLFVGQLQPTTGLKDFLDGLGIQKCVASSSSLERINYSLGLTGIIDYFSQAQIFSSSMVKRGKPAPDLFLHAAEKLGMVPEHCVVIEDSPYGVEGGIAAGMQVIGYTGGGHSEPTHEARLRKAGAQHVCETWIQVRSVLHGL
jgi:HAD superfamily hydrolase (TIGR01509 family)